MLINRIVASNFRSFRELDLELRGFSVLVGANASGKSNLLEIIRFWRDAARYGVENAISIQGGCEFLLHRSQAQADTLSMGISFDSDLALITKPKTGFISINSVDYSFRLRFHSNGFQILSDELTLHTDWRMDPSDKSNKHGSIHFFRSDLRRGTYKMEQDGELPPRELLSPILSTSNRSVFKLGKKLLIDVTPALMFAQFSKEVPRISTWDTTLSKIGFYDFDPKVAKQSSAMTGLLELKSDGSNLATVLHRILGKSDTRKRFTALLQETLPQIDKVKVQQHLDRAIMYGVSETWTDGGFFPSPLLSDGTVNITAMIAAVFFEEISMAVLEEPERNLHPGLVRAVVDLLHDASVKRQVIVSTHSPELVKYAGVESLIFVRRGTGGSSEVVHPSDSNMVKEFLEKDIGLDKVFVMDMLDVEDADA